mmetsp:Transcript_29071/g.74179  ORF Transcript_29071/g.74179 Transcript_29071/m.74179 type:complete len:211 (-) Transcript_29071:758-1390(-)
MGGGTGLAGMWPGTMLSPRPPADTDRLACGAPTLTAAASPGGTEGSAEGAVTRACGPPDIAAAAGIWTRMFCAPPPSSSLAARATSASIWLWLCGLRQAASSARNRSFMRPAPSGSAVRNQGWRWMSAMVARWLGSVLSMRRSTSTQSVDSEGSTSAGNSMSFCIMRWNSLIICCCSLRSASVVRRYGWRPNSMMNAHTPHAHTSAACPS